MTLPPLNLNYDLLCKAITALIFHIQMYVIICIHELSITDINSPLLYKPIAHTSQNSSLS